MHNDVKYIITDRTQGEARHASHPSPPSLRGAKRRSNTEFLRGKTGLLPPLLKLRRTSRCARNDSWDEQRESDFHRVHGNSPSPDPLPVRTGRASEAVMRPLLRQTDHAAC